MRWRAVLARHRAAWCVHVDRTLNGDAHLEGLHRCGLRCEGSIDLAQLPCCKALFRANSDHTYLAECEIWLHKIVPMGPHPC